MPIYSHSRVGCFESCPKKYYFSYIERPEIERKEGIEAFMGSRVHKTLEKLYTDLRFTKQNSLNELLSFYEKQWKKNWKDSIVAVKEGLKPEHYFSLGKKCIENYFNRHQPFDSDKTIACEKKVYFPLDESGHYKMTGVIDRLAEEKPGHYVIHDYKTSGSLPPQESFEQDRQLALYSIAVFNDFKDCEDIKLCWHYLVFDKDFYSKRTEEQLSQLKKEVISLIQETERAEQENLFPVKESKLCGWCQYSELCPVHKHAARVERLPLKEFRQDEGVQLVDKYIALEGKLKKAQLELNELKERIFGYAAQFKLEKISGKEAALKIYHSIGFSFAGLKQEEKQELMDLLKKEGLLKKFLALDTRALGSAVARKEIEPKTSKKLEKFGEEKETKGVRLVGE